MPTAVVTGANRGIGLEVARALAERGYKVWLGARDEARGRQAEAELKAAGLDVAWLPLDVADDASVASAARTVAEATPALDALVKTKSINAAPQSVGAFYDNRYVQQVNTQLRIR